MTMLDDRTPATVQARPEPPWPKPGRCAGEGSSSAPGRPVSSHRGPLPGIAWMADSVLMNGSEWLHLPGKPWSMRLAPGSGGRLALEIHAGGSLIDVMVSGTTRRGRERRRQVLVR
jgi:hypothetical protein